MPAETLVGLQGLTAIVNLAVWVSKAENAPKEVSRCLELVQLIYRDTQYLIELRNENLETLEQTPRELERINEIIITATRSIRDVGRLLEKYRPEAHGGHTSLKSRIIWVVADSETFALRAPNLMTQHSTILTEIQSLRTFQVMAPILKVAGKAEQAEKQRNFENVNLLRSLMGGTTRSLTDDVVTRKLTLASLETSDESSLSIPSLSPRPRTPQYDVLGHTIPQTEVDAHRGLRHQPSLLSLFTPTPPPPYSPPTTGVTANTTTRPSETGPRFSPPVHLYAPYQMSKGITDASSANQADPAQHAPRNQSLPSHFTGITAFSPTEVALSRPDDMQNSVHGQHRQSWDVSPIRNSIYAQSPPLTTADGWSRSSQISLSSNDREITPKQHVPTHDAAWNRLSPDYQLAQGLSEHWSLPTVPEMPSLTTKASNLSMLFSHKAISSTATQEPFHESGTEHSKREVLFELEGSVPPPNQST